MSYSEIVEQLFNMHHGMNLGLQNVEDLQRLLHFPDRSFRSIHVAGTNGKGSVCIKIARALELQGYKVGLYTSPHLSCIRERIKINGELIPEKAVEAIYPQLMQLIKEKNISITFFELITFLAFLHFAEEKVDFAVLETGLGGRLDATNIITPLLSIITSISLDHTDILGLTEDAIAFEKGGIIKENVPIIIGPRVPSSVIQKIAIEKNAPFFQVKVNSLIYEIENRAIVKEGLKELSKHIPLSAEAIEKGLEAKQPCRFEVVAGFPTIILDVAHNPNGISALFKSLQHHFPNKKYRLLFGLSKSKDLKSCLNEIFPFSDHFHLIEATNGRAAAKESLYQHLLQLSVPNEQISLHNSIEEGVNIAKEMAIKNHQMLVIFGTFFIMSDVRQILGFQEPRDQCELNIDGGSDKKSWQK